MLVFGFKKSNGFIVRGHTKIMFISHNYEKSKFQKIQLLPLFSLYKYSVCYAQIAFLMLRRYDYRQYWVQPFKDYTQVLSILPLDVKFHYYCYCYCYCYYYCYWAKIYRHYATNCKPRLSLPVLTAKNSKHEKQTMWNPVSHKLTSHATDNNIAK